MAGRRRNPKGLIADIINVVYNGTVEDKTLNELLK